MCSHKIYSGFLLCYRLGYTGSSALGPDSTALATQPGYEFMDRKSPVQDSGFEYEVLVPGKQFEPREPSIPPGQYEMVSFPARPISEGPPRTSLATSPPIYEIAPTPILAPQEHYPASSNVSQSPPVYEIAPPPRPQIPARPPPYSVPAARTSPNNVPPARPPQDNVPLERAPHQNVPLIEGMEGKDQPVLPPPRLGNEYQQHRPIQPMGEPPRALNQPAVPPPYEKVRLEGPKGGKLNLEQAPTPVLPPRTHLGIVRYFQIYTTRRHKSSVIFYLTLLIFIIYREI